MRRLATYPDRIDWFRVLADLQRAGHSLKHVSSQLKIPYSTLHGWRDGAEPGYSHGEQLLAMWVNLTGRERLQAPTMGQALASQRAALQG